MKINSTRRALTVVLSLAILFSLFASAVQAAPSALPAVPVTFTILHTNDFHGQLEEMLATPGTSSNPGMARVATAVNDVRTAVGADKVLLVDAGDEMQGSLLSNLGKGLPTIATFNAMGYNLATFGNHEFDWGQTVLADRTTQATYPYVTANIVKNNTGNCATAGWMKPDFADAPYQIFTMGTAPDTVKVAFITLDSPFVEVGVPLAALGGNFWVDEHRTKATGLRGTVVLTIGDAVEVEITAVDENLRRVSAWVIAAKAQDAHGKVFQFVPMLAAPATLREGDIEKPRARRAAKTGGERDRRDSAPQGRPPKKARETSGKSREAHPKPPKGSIKGTGKRKAR